MNNPIWLIVQREFITRVRKKTFLLLTIFGPLILGALMIVPGILASLPEDGKSILVLDEPAMLVPHEGNKQYSFRYLDPRDFSLELAKDTFAQSGFDALLYIPTGANWDPDFIKDNIILYGKDDPSIEMHGYLQDILEQRINDEKLLQQGVDPEIVAQTKTSVNIKAFKIDGEDGEEKTSATPIKMALGYIMGIFIYFFIFFYSTQVMRGVIEEKTSRIVEVIISSVRPFQLMMGKILGVGAVGILQFFIWVVLTGLIYIVASTFLFADLFSAQEAAMAGSPAEGLANSPALEVLDMLQSINFPVILGGFAFYFFAGYFLYSALFAAVGSAVDQETDSQQFMLPVTAPIIIAVVTAMNVIKEPNGDLAFWMSIFPLTSPISMIIRLPFGVPVWQVLLSAGLLIASFFGVVSFAGKIYRVGILMYGKKITWKELFKWLKY